MSYGTRCFDTKYN